jgi:hypothetical protein
MFPSFLSFYVFITIEKDTKNSYRNYKSNSGRLFIFETHSASSMHPPIHGLRAKTARDGTDPTTAARKTAYSTPRGFGPQTADRKA